MNVSLHAALSGDRYHMSKYTSLVVRQYILFYNIILDSIEKNKKNCMIITVVVSVVLKAWSIDPGTDSTVYGEWMNE